MKLSTILTAVVAVTAIGTVGAVAYTKIKKENTNEVTPEENVEADEDDEPDEELETTIKPISPKRVAIAAAIGCACGLVALPLTTVMMYRSTLCTLTQRAIDNGNLTFEELIDLANNVSQEVA